MTSSSLNSISVHCRNIAGQWIGALRNCGETARIFSPYITSRLADNVIASEAPSNVEIYTRFDIQAFASGASSLLTLRSLLRRGFPVFDVERLHAKVFTSPKGFASVGSQNLTQRGTTNREASVVIREPELLNQLTRQLERWVALRIPITLDMVYEAEIAIEELLKQFRELNRKCSRIEKEISRKQLAREKAKKRAEQQAERDRREQLAKEQDEKKRLAEAKVTQETKLKELLERFRKNGLPPKDETPLATTGSLVSYQMLRNARLSKLGDGKTVSKETCYQIAQNAMDWEMNGRIMRAPGDANHLYKGPLGWEINRGGSSANRFGVELAIKWCREKLAAYFPENEPRTDGLSDTELRELTRMVRCAIIGANNKPYYDSYRPEEQYRISLGNHFLVPGRTARAIVALAGFPLGNAPS